MLVVEHQDRVHVAVMMQLSSAPAPPSGSRQEKNGHFISAPRDVKGFGRVETETTTVISNSV